MELREHIAGLVGASSIVELTGGHQAQVFRADRPTGPVIVKVHDAALVERHDVELRLQVAADLARLGAHVCAPVALDGRLLHDLTGPSGTDHLVACFELADGTELDPTTPADAALMGRALGELHGVMARVPPVDLPPVAALRTGASGADADLAGHQLLHGDFNAGNVRVAAGIVTTFDLDDCGYGPPAFDVANALYMVLFDAVVGERPDGYRVFRAAFVPAYATAGATAVADERLDELIDRRVDALRGWLDDLDHAPAGIRTSSAAWQATLRRFVVGHDAARR